ncbi:hypothetical protein HDU76_008108 [Blyttiomyces sp. JEL0837]|nr:hypothetical protein HDU76_008108 [Blyttiomyces sp. JEL0837]
MVIGRGRGAYYKEKYGRGGRGNSHADNRHESNQSWQERPQSASPRWLNDLPSTLTSLNGQQYGRLKSLHGQYQTQNGMSLYIDYVQSDPFAPPSKIRVRVPQVLAMFPADLYRTPIRALISALHKQGLHVANRGSGWSGGKGGDFDMDKPGQQVLQRTALIINSTFVEARLSFNFPAQGRSIMGRQAAQLLGEMIWTVAEKSLIYQSLDTKALTHHVQSIEDQEALRELVIKNGLVAFVREGAILPRVSGASDLPLPSSTALPFVSPPSLLVEFKLPNMGVIKGMGIPRGVTLITGGGFHGKSTLLKALQMGVYNHIPSDGREFVVTDESSMKIRAEDGRCFTSVNISPFINNLPLGSNTSSFSTPDASGSTSMAASIQEALECGCRALLFDEDSCATNFLIRDNRMTMLVNKEPITPLISKIQSLYKDYKCSSILVIGGCGSYLDVANLVIGMDNYKATDMTARAAEIVKLLPESRETLAYGSVTARSLSLRTLQPIQVEQEEDFDSEAPRNTKSSAKSTKTVTFTGTEIDLSGLEQIAHASQSRGIIEVMLQLKEKDTWFTASSARNYLQQVLTSEEGIDRLRSTQYPIGNIARPRFLDVMGAINRLRGDYLNARAKQGFSWDDFAQLKAKKEELQGGGAFSEKEMLAIHLEKYRQQLDSERAEKLSKAKKKKDKDKDKKKKDKKKKDKKKKSKEKDKGKKRRHKDDSSSDDSSGSDSDGSQHRKRSKKDSEDRQYVNEGSSKRPEDDDRDSGSRSHDILSRDELVEDGELAQGKDLDGDHNTGNNHHDEDNESSSEGKKYCHDDVAETNARDFDNYSPPRSSSRRLSRSASPGYRRRDTRLSVSRSRSPPRSSRQLDHYSPPKARSSKDHYSPPAAVRRTTDHYSPARGRERDIGHRSRERVDHYSPDRSDRRSRSAENEGEKPSDEQSQKEDSERSEKDEFDKPENRD